MLLYHPLYDAHHCAFRLLALCKDCKISNLYWEQVKIFDFYTLFPHLLSEIRLPEELKSNRPALRRISVPYEDLPSPKRLLFALAEIQEQIVRSLVAKGIIDRDLFSQGKIKVRDFMLDPKLVALVDRNPLREFDWYKFITKELVLVPVMGANGLKDRTGLMEYRYDPV